MDFIMPINYFYLRKTEERLLCRLNLMTRKVKNTWSKGNLRMTVQAKIHQSFQHNALRASIYIYIRQLSSFWAPTLWFIGLTVVACHIQYTFLSLCQFCSRENGTRNYAKAAILLWYENGRRRLLGAQSINAERTSFHCSQSDKQWCTEYPPHSTLNL